MSIEKKLQDGLGSLMFREMILSDQLEEAAKQTMAVYEALDAVWAGLPSEAQAVLLGTAYGVWKNNKKG